MATLAQASLPVDGQPQKEQATGNKQQGPIPPLVACCLLLVARLTRACVRMKDKVGREVTMQCPRCSTVLQIERYEGIEVDRCPSCNGRWLDHDELDQLEATVASEAERRATIVYSPRASELACPKCGKRMTTFDYRAYNLELDTCEDGHGFWLDAGEEGRVRDIVEERVRGLARADSAEKAWGHFLASMGRRSLWDQIKGIFGGR
jgi:Zn-finger nucleic acid-binding protein